MTIYLGEESEIKLFPLFPFNCLPFSLPFPFPPLILLPLPSFFSLSSFSFLPSFKEETLDSNKFAFFN